MATINLEWIPGGGTATAQRVLRIAKANGTVPSLTTVFSPANDLSAAATIAAAQSLNTNTIYKFNVKSICPGGYTVNNTNGVVEDLVFECLDDADVDITAEISPSSSAFADVEVTAALPNPTPVDGGGSVANYTDITKVEFSVYDAANVVLIAAPVVVAGTILVPPSHSFYLPVDTDYTLRYVLITTINSVEVRSDAAKYLGAACTKEFTTIGL